MANYNDLAKEIGELTTRKQAGYGDSFGKCNKILLALYPNGIKPEDYMNMAAMIRIIDKFFRLATDPSFGEESPWRDIAGYGLLGYAASPVKQTKSKTKGLIKSTNTKKK